MLGSISIKGFKSVVEAKIELGRLNVFVGANGAGKSVVLEALGVLGAAADGRVDDASLMRRGVRPGVPALYKNAFAEDSIPSVISLAAHSRDASPSRYYVSLDSLIDQGGSPWRFTHELLATGEGTRERKYVSRRPGRATLWGPRKKSQSFKPHDATRSVADTPNPLGDPPESVRGLLSTLRNYAIYDPQTPVLRGIIPDASPLDPMGIGGGRLAEALLEAFPVDGSGEEDLPAQFFNLVGWANRVGSGPPAPSFVAPSVAQARNIVWFIDRFMRKGRNELSAYDASEGALYVLFAFVLLHHPRAPQTLAIENVDHALHPRLARSLVELMATWVKERDKQLLLTTHNPLVLDALDLRDDDVRLFTVDRDKYGHTVVRRLPFTKALEEAQRSGLTLSQMWTRGLIGAVPNIL